MNEDILEKVRKLLALGENSQFSNEAEQAFAQAQRLLTKHRLSMLDLGTKNNSQDVEINVSQLPMFKRHNTSLWLEMVANAIAKANNCKFFIRTFANPRSIEYHLIGTKEDQEICKYLFDSISSQIECMCQFEMKRVCGHGKTWSNNFKHGAAQTIDKRLQEGKKQALLEEAQNCQTAIVLMSSLAEKVERWTAQNLNLNTRKITYNTRSNASAFTLGKNAGEKVNLTGKVKNTPLLS